MANWGRTGEEHQEYLREVDNELVNRRTFIPIFELKDRGFGFRIKLLPNGIYIPDHIEGYPGIKFVFADRVDKDSLSVALDFLDKEKI